MSDETLIKETAERIKMIGDSIDVPMHIKDARQMARAALAVVEKRRGWRPTHRYIKTGSEYRLIGRAYIQTEVPLIDYALAVIYRGADGRLWARRAVEFDERFKPLPAPPKENDDG